MFIDHFLKLHTASNKSYRIPPLVLLYQHVFERDKAQSHFWLIFAARRQN
jgi:hypothetical protein